MYTCTYVYIFIYLLKNKFILVYIYTYIIYIPIYYMSALPSVICPILVLQYEPDICPWPCQFSPCSQDS